MIIEEEEENDHRKLSDIIISLECLLRRISLILIFPIILCVCVCVCVFYFISLLIIYKITDNQLARRTKESIDGIHRWFIDE